MTKTWRYEDPDGTVTMTEDEILAVYFDFWSEEMRKVGKESEITPQGCIDDWVVVHWAERVKE